MGKVNAIRGAFRPVSLGLLLAGAVSACASPPPPFPDLPRLGVSTQLGSRNLCGLGVSPAISISGAPQATAQYRLRLTNIDVLFQQPWQTTVSAEGTGTIPEGAIADYTAPCVGELSLYTFYQYQRYRLEVMAVDQQNRPLAYGQASLLVQSVSTTLDRERAVLRQAAPGTPPPPAPPPIGRPALNDYNTIGTQVSPVLIPQIPGPVPQP
jgi:hypothetical protein